MKVEDIAQWVIANRYPKNELDKISDSEMYYFLIKEIKQLLSHEFGTLLEIVKSDLQDAIEKQEECEQEEFNSGREDALIYIKLIINQTLKEYETK